MSSFLKGNKDQVEVQLKAEVGVDLGKTITVPFKATYKVPGVREAKDLFERAKNGDITDDDIIAEYLITWSELEGSSGEPVEFTKETLAEAMDHKDYRATLVDGFMKLALDPRVYEAALGKN